MYSAGTHSLKANASAGRTAPAHCKLIVNCSSTLNRLARVVCWFPSSWNGSLAHTLDDFSPPPLSPWPPAHTRSGFLQLLEMISTHGWRQIVQELPSTPPYHHCLQNWPPALLTAAVHFRKGSSQAFISLINWRGRLQASGFEKHRALEADDVSHSHWRPSLAENRPIQGQLVPFWPLRSQGL